MSKSGKLIESLEVDQSEALEQLDNSVTENTVDEDLKKDVLNLTKSISKDLDKELNAFLKDKLKELKSKHKGLSFELRSLGKPSPVSGTANTASGAKSLFEFILVVDQYSE